MVKVLIADDEATIRSLVSRHLANQGYEVVETGNGEDAFNILAGDHPPQIAILDWLMPGLSGPEVCQKILAKTESPFIYLILLTVKTGRKARHEALLRGAHDFISKPLDLEELHCRMTVGRRLVEAHEKIKEQVLLEQQSRELATRMQTLAEERARQLFHADRLVSLGTLAVGLAHEISNALGYICNGLYETQYQYDKITPILRELANSVPDQRTALTTYVDETLPAMDVIHEGINRVINIVEDLRNFARQGANQRESCAVGTLAARAAKLCRYLTRQHNVEIVQHFAADIPPVLVNPQQLEQVFVNIIKNAVEAMSAQRGGKVTMTGESRDGKIRISLIDTGPGIPEALLNRIWEPFFTTKGAERGTGLGLSICREIIQDLGGNIWAARPPEGGAAFHIELPPAP